MFCKHCGKEIDDGSQFCVSCGFEIKDTSNKEANPYAPPKFSSEFTVVEDKSLWGYFVGGFKKYAVFQGRARRKEYWGFFLFYAIFSNVASVLDMIIFGLEYSDYGAIYIIWFLVTLLPYLSVCVRRYHDCNRSGWVILIPIYNIVLDFIEGTHGPNRFGDDPKRVQSVTNNDVASVTKTDFDRK